MENRHGSGDWDGAEAEVKRINQAYGAGEQRELCVRMGLRSAGFGKIADTTPTAQVTVIKLASGNFQLQYYGGKDIGLVRELIEDSHGEKGMTREGRLQRLTQAGVKIVEEK